MLTFPAEITHIVLVQNHVIGAIWPIGKIRTTARSLELACFLGTKAALSRNSWNALEEVIEMG